MQRSTASWRWLLAGLIMLHGLIHFLGVVRAFGLAAMSQLTAPIGAVGGVAWLVAGLLLLATGAAVILRPRSWWVVGIPAVVLSQVVIVASWRDAMFGTVANTVILLAAVHAFAAAGPVGLRARYRRYLHERLPVPGPESRISEEDLAALPAPVRRYVRMTGAVGRPRVRHVRAYWRGRIRSTPDAPWMEFTAVQHNFVGEPARFFLMDARRGRLPVDVLHAYRAGTATMHVRLLSLFPMAKAAGLDMDRAETVTVFNDLCILAPGALIDPHIRWETVDDHFARGFYTVGDITVSAVLEFNDRDELVDFVSDDRLAMSADGSSFERQRWSTPLRDYRAIRSRRVWTHGHARWHPPDAPPYTYMDGELVDVEANPDRPEPPDPAPASTPAIAVPPPSGSPSV